MAKFSTGLRNAALFDSDIDTAISGGSVRYFSGAVPATADAAETGTLLVVVTNPTNGCAFDAPVGGVMPKAAADVWDGINSATGTATYARLVAPGDTGALSTTEARIQLTVGTVGTDLLMDNPLRTSGQITTLSYFAISLPTL